MNSGLESARPFPLNAATDSRFCYNMSRATQDSFMHNLSFHDARHAGGLLGLHTIGALAVLVALACSGATAWAQTAGRTTDPAIRPEFREPVTLASKDGVLEVRLTA